MHLYYKPLVTAILFCNNFMSTALEKFIILFKKLLETSLTKDRSTANNSAILTIFFPSYAILSYTIVLPCTWLRWIPLYHSHRTRFQSVKLSLNHNKFISQSITLLPSVDHRKNRSFSFNHSSVSSSALRSSNT